MVITGTPCSGKTAISGKLKRMLGDCDLISANDVVKEMRLFSGRSAGGELIVRMSGLRSEIIRRIRRSRAGTVIVEGHLLCDISIPGATAIVLREHLATLLKRMRKRGYSRRKMEGNVVSEAIDYCGVNAAENYVSVHEVRSGPGAPREIIGIIRGRPESGKDIDMLGELDGLAKELGQAVL